MRIVVVSAHYPPNFVSGGTLTPQRLARGLRQRGHDVRVFAGWLGERRPLDQWEETDTTGLPVRWIVTSPWIGWDDTRNFDNPPVTDAFRRYLTGVRPDVVHFHALQSVGSGLLEAAADAGAKVAVTMHDFWWWCARQFLVDRSMTPCSVVVDAGVCPCQVDRPWLDARNRLLATRLCRADLVLAPSASAARVFAANGVDPRKLMVNANGLTTDDQDRRAGEPPDGEGRLRLLYVGGANPMKGVHVLLDAAGRLADRPGWELVAYGAEEYVRENGLVLNGLPVNLRDPFDPADVSHVYADADVLVVPSVMRESHSLVTREALQRGLPVLCTDTFGPEEVVDDGRNGLIVPAADAGALAAAIVRLLDEPDLLRRLRDGCRPPPAVPSMEEQLDHLERSLEGLVAARRPPPTGRRVGRVLFVCGIEGAPLHYRATIPAEALTLLGVTSDVRQYRDPDVPACARRADAVVIYRVPATVQVLALIQQLRASGTPVYFDVDDLIFDPDLAAEIPALSILPGDEAALWLQGVRRYRMTMEACDAFIGSTPALCRHAAAVTGLPVRQFENGVSLALARLADEVVRKERPARPARIGYLSGTNTHDHDWWMIEGALTTVMVQHPDVELWLVGFVPPTPGLDRFGPRIVRLPLLPWSELPAILGNLDVNLAPLAPDSRFNEAKSAIKWLEAALTATPTIASPTEPFRDVVDHGRNGWLAEEAGDWIEGLRRLLGDETMRKAMGARARRDALLRFSPHVQGRRYLEILTDGALRDGLPPAPRWPEDVLDEPALPVMEPATRQGRVRRVLRRLRG